MQAMLNTVIHTSENNNFYLYDDRSRSSMLIHPELSKVHKNSTAIDPYYEGKYAYLKSHGFFANPEPVDFKTEVDESMVQKGIIETNQIVFEVTDACNLKCSYCVLGELYGGDEIENTKNINAHSAINLLKYIFKLKLENNKTKLYISFYGGEPLLNIPFVKQIVEVVNQLNAEKEIDIHYLMTTNGTLIHKHLPFLVENKFDVMISLDGNEENDSYRSFRKNSQTTFRQVIENVDKIEREYPDYFNHRVSFNAVLHDRNSVKDIYEFIYNRYHKIPQISELSPAHISPDKKCHFDKMFNSMSKSEADYQQEDTELTHLTHPATVNFNELTNFLKYYSIHFYVSNLTSSLLNKEKVLPTNTCLPFSKKIFLTTRNQLFPCEKTNYQYAMGEVNPDVTLDIPAITRQINAYYRGFQKTCQHCYIHRFCGVCMFRLDGLEKGNAEKPVCDRFHNQKAFQTKLGRIFSFLETYPEDLSEIIENVTITS